MDPIAAGRFCQHCVKPVFDLSAMSESDARALLKANEGRAICISYRHDGQGGVRFQPPARSRLVSLRRPVRSGAGAAVLAGALAACSPHDNPDVVDRTPAAAIELPTETRPEAYQPFAVSEPESPPPVKGEMRPVELPPPADVRVKGDWAGPVHKPEPKPVRSPADCRLEVGPVASGAPVR